VSGSELDRHPAELIPDEYVLMRGTPVARVMELVDRAWKACPEEAKRQLAQALLAILAPLNVAKPKVTADLRRECLDTVNLWLTMQSGHLKRGTF
jgi:hypothetical protein